MRIFRHGLFRGWFLSHVQNSSCALGNGELLGILHSSRAVKYRPNTALRSSWLGKYRLSATEYRAKTGRFVFRTGYWQLGTEVNSWSKPAAGRSASTLP